MFSLSWNLVFCFGIFGPRREQQLNALLRLYEENEDAMCEALLKDLHKCRQEAIINEVELLRNDVRNLIMNLRSYAAIEYVSVFPILILDAYSVQLEPKHEWKCLLNVP